MYDGNRTQFMRRTLLAYFLLVGAMVFGASRPGFSLEQRGAIILIGTAAIVVVALFHRWIFWRRGGTREELFELWYGGKFGRFVRTLMIIVVVGKAVELIVRW